jgi:glycerophosphoryl diester phosphodiesterase
MKASKQKGNRLLVRAHYFLALILLFHAIFFITYWLSVGRFRLDVDQFVGAQIGLSLPYTTILIVLYAVVTLWSLIRFVRLRLAVRNESMNPIGRDLVYAIIWLVAMLGIYLSFYFILQQEPSQKGVLIHLINLARLVGDTVIFFFAAIWLRRLIIGLRKKMQQAPQSGKWPWTVLIGLVLVSLVGMWLVPALFPPNWAYQGDLPTRPALVAHRGASMLAPENTLASGELAAEYQALGFETDVRISLDGVPFLMHDDTLARTTNIAEIFPDRVDEDASSFTMDELKQLNAGLWFIQKDPFGTIKDGLVSQSQLGVNQGQQIPTLAEALEMVQDQNMVIMFDMRYPPTEHPYSDKFFDVVLQTCLESGLNGDIWFLADEEHLAMLQEEAPQMTRVVGVSSSDLPDATALLDLHYEIVNVDTGITTKEIQAYRDKGLGVNVYTIDEPWLFSQYWLSGVTSVTTNNVQSFSQLQKPYLNLSYSRYLLFWGVYGIILAIWLASSQPGPERGPEKPVTTPDLMDFALEDERLEAMGAEPVTPEPEPVDEVIEPVGDEVEEPVVEDDAGEDVLSADSWSKVEADEEGTEDNKENEENDEAES